MGNIEEPVDSILELLTYPNPKVQHSEAKSKTNSKHPLYHIPTEVKKWGEFDDFTVLGEVFGGDLLKEARQARKLHPPKVRETNCNVESSEPKVRALLEKWNQEIVMSAIDPILNRFHPVIWEKGEPPTDEIDDGYESPAPPEKQRSQPGRKCAGKRKKGPKSYPRFKPDSGSVSSNPACEKDKGREKFVKEYKVATKWKSRWIRERGLVDEFGKWRKDLSRKNPAGLPVIQTYTYCVQNMCRYGCILTCEEAFIFRVRPINEISGSKSSNPMRAGLVNNGLLEYVSIPWDIHFRHEPEACDSWTVNLALWFVHVLAGNKADVNWTYPLLPIETALDSLHSEAKETTVPQTTEVAEDDPNETVQDEVNAADGSSSIVASRTGALPVASESRGLTKRKWEMEEEQASDTESDTEREEEEEVDTDDRFELSFDAKRRSIWT